MDIEKELNNYLRSELVKIRKTNPITKFVLRHASPGSKGNEVESWEHDSAIKLEDIPRLAADILGRAQTDSDGLGPGVHRYTFSAVAKGEGKTTRLMFRLRGGEESDEESVGGEDSPTMKGLTQQLMRHNEATQRTLISSVGTMLSLMGRRMESQDAEMTQMRRERSETFLALEEAKSQQHDRDMTAMETMNADKRKDMAFNKIMQLAPAVVNRISGKNLLPEKTSPMDMMLENLVKSLDETQFAAIASQLRPDQQLTFVEILRTFQARQSAEEKKEN